jgi:inosose dehydratase
MTATDWPIGINPIGWSNDDLLELGGETPLESCLAEARLAGYAGIELGNKFPRDAHVLRPILARHELRLVSGWYSARLLERSAEAEIVAMAAHEALLRTMGCEVMVFAEVTGCVHGQRGVALSTRPRLSARDWSGFADRLTVVARHLESRGLKLVYHHHMGTAIESADEVDRLMAETGPEVGLLLDTGHLAYAGADAVEVIRRHCARIRHVHCKDVRPAVLARAKADDASFLDAVIDGVFTVPGDGAVDFAAVFAALKAAGYAGWLVVEAEQDPAKAEPLSYARLGRAGIARALAQA